jgi:hypothetical protein
MGSDSGAYNGLLYSDGLLVNNGSLNNTLNWVDLVGLWDGDCTWDGNFVWFWDMFVVDNGSFNWDWDCYRYIIGDFVDLEFRLNAVKTGSDNGVGTDWGLYCMSSYGIKRCRSKITCWSR